MKNKQKTILIVGLSLIAIFVVGLIISLCLKKNDDNVPPVSFDTYIATNIGQIEERGAYNLATKKNIYNASDTGSQVCSNIMNGIVDCFTEFPANYNPYDPYDEYPAKGDYLINYESYYCGFNGMGYEFLILCKEKANNLYSYAVIFSSEIEVSGSEFLHSQSCIEVLNSL